MENIMAPVSPGELLDKITILRLKSENIADESKLANVQYELDVLEQLSDEKIPVSNELTELVDALQTSNARLWEIEDDIRQCEKDQDFGDRFIAFARAVYITNDERARVKKQINTYLGSKIIEEKDY